MQIREAIESDTNTISLLARQTFTETYDDLNEEQVDRYVSEFFSISKIREYINSPNYRILVADRGQLAGYTLLGKSLAPEFLKADKPVECIRLFVVKDAQGQKLGSKLLESALAICTKEGNDMLWLKVWDKNEKAIRFYEKNDFLPMGISNYTEGGLDDQVIIMGRLAEKSNTI